MIEALIISQVLMWILLLGVAILQLALLRQIGVLHERIAPMGALTLDKGPAEGEPAPVFTVADLSQHTVQVGGVDTEGKSTLLFFLSPTCPVCKKMLPILKSLARSESEWLRIQLSSDGELAEHQRFARTNDLGGFAYLLSRDLGMTYRVNRLPYAVLIDGEGKIRAKGLINTREHLESLIEAKQMGVASIQDYLRESSGGRPR